MSMAIPTKDVFAMDALRTLNETEAAEILGLSVKTIRYWRWSQRGPRYLKLGNRVKYRAADLEAWMEERTVNPEARA